jgi:CheY-like chemotaxis protein
MNILIVEDSDAKRESVSALIDKNYSGHNLIYALSVRSAIDILPVSDPGLIIADMSLPTYDIENRERGGTPRPFGGIEVFDHLDRFEITVPVVVVTSYPTLGDGENSLNIEQLRKRLQLDFPDNYLGVVYFDSVYTTWESDFLDLVHPILYK